MAFRRLVIFSCISVWLAAVTVPFMAHADITSTAPHAIIMDAKTGEVLFEHDAEKPMVPSSMTKLMTLYLLFERLQKGILKLDDTFHVSKKAWKMGGSKMFVRVDTNVKISDLIQGIAIQSGNDACIVVAEGIAGSEDAFVKLMNAKAKELGMNHTNFMDANGWPEEGHYMSAHDIATLARHLINDFPEYYHYFSEPSFTYNNIQQGNRNLLVTREGINVDGLKTGHTEAGGYGMVVSGTQGGQRLIVVVNGMDSTFARADEAERLLSYGFRYFEHDKVLSANQVVTDAPLWEGEQETVPLKVKDDVEAMLPKLGKDKVKLEVHFNSPIAAPVKEGQQLGEAHLIVPNQKDRAIPLYAGKSVARQGFLARFWNHLLNRSEDVADAATTTAR